MVKLSYFLPQASDPVAMKKQLVECGVLDLTNELIYKMAPEAVDPAILSRGSLSIRQYTRSALKLLRDDSLSKNRPFCMHDSKLRTFDIWKLSHSYKYQDSSQSTGNDDGSTSYHGSPFENKNRNGSFRQYSPYRSRSFNEGGKNFSSSSHLMPSFMVRQQKQNTKEKEIYFGPERESFETESHQADREKSEDKGVSKEVELPVNNPHQTKNSELSVEKTSKQQNQRERRNSLFLYPQDGDDECSTDGKNLDLKNNPTTISSKSNTEIGVSNPSNPVLNRDERRIGSGRISLGNEWDYFNKDIDKGSLRNNSRQIGPEEHQMSRQDRFHTSRNRRRYDSYSSKSNTSNDEPEWFSAGPTSRLEVIELHGFDDDDCSSIASDSKNAVGSAGADKPGVNNKKDDEIASVTTSQSSPPPARSTPTKYGHKKHENRTKSSNNANHNKNDSNKSEFMFDTFFNPFASGSGDDKKTHLSQPEKEPRLNPWYDSKSSDINVQRNSNPQASNRKPFYDNWTENSNNSTGKNTSHQNDFFNNNNIKTQFPCHVPNVEELEAKMFHAGKTNQENLMQLLANMNNKQYQDQQHQEKEKFKYLINQMSSVNVANKSVNFYEEQQKKNLYLLKHQQQQDVLRVAELLQKFAAYSLTAAPIHQMSRGEILNRPEAQALLQAIVRNEITINSLVQIVNTAVPFISRNSIFEYNREIILTVLNFIQLQKQHQQQQAAMQVNSQLNLMNNILPISQNLPQRVPSAQELQFHTQSIMKSALLRKKMEGQTNQGSSINDTFGDFMLESSLSSSTNPFTSIHTNNNNKFHLPNILFTPTSVLKNINAAAGNRNNIMWQKIQTADKLIADNGEMQNKLDFDEPTGQLDSNIEPTQKHIQWTKPELYKPNNNMKSIGRSILKKSTNNNEPIQNLLLENAGELQLSQQQQQPQEPSSTSYSNISPSKNQLAKWFTPELLAEASAGKLPSLNRNEVVFLEEFEKNTHQS